MRTIETKVYTFDELSETAKEKARDWIRENNREMGYPWTKENEDSLNAFAALFPIRVTDWQYNSYGGVDGVTFTIEHEGVESLEGYRLARWLENNIYSKLYKGKYYSTPGQYVDGQYTFKARRSKCQKEASCELTGYCMDDTLAAPVLEFMKRPRAGVTLRELLNDCFDNWAKACVDDIEYQDSEEVVDETIRANEYEFTEDGEVA